jgi:hypothetical protein
MEEVDGICLNRATEKNRYFQVFGVLNQVFQAIFVFPVQQKSKASFILVFAKEDYRPFKIRIFHKGVSDQQYAGGGTVHIRKLTNPKDIV